MYLTMPGLASRDSLQHCVVVLKLSRLTFVAEWKGAIAQPNIVTVSKACCVRLEIMMWGNPRGWVEASVADHIPVRANIETLWKIIIEFRIRRQLLR